MRLALMEHLTNNVTSQCHGRQIDINMSGATAIVESTQMTLQAMPDISVAPLIFMKDLNRLNFI